MFNKTTKYIALFGLIILISDTALASTFSVGMPWEPTSDKVVRMLAGPMGKVIALFSLTVFGLLWILGDYKWQLVAKVGTGLSVVFHGVIYILPMVGFAQGALL